MASYKICTPTSGDNFYPIYYHFNLFYFQWLKNPFHPFMGALNLCLLPGFILTNCLYPIHLHAIKRHPPLTGIICPQTPMGSCRVQQKKSPSMGMVFPSHLSAQPAQYLNTPPEGQARRLCKTPGSADNLWRYLKHFTTLGKSTEYATAQGFPLSRVSSSYGNSINSV